MGQITTLFVSKVLAQLSAGVDQKALLARLGLTLEQPVDPARMIDDDAYYTLLEAIADADPAVVDLPLRTGASMRCDDYGAFGLAYKAAVNLRHSWARAERYGRILTSVTRYELRERGAQTTLIAHREGERRLGMRLSIEATLASVVSISREVSSAPFTPTRIDLRHPAPAEVGHHEAYFGCPVRFGETHDAVHVATQDLKAGNHLGDESISTFFDAHLQAQMRQFPDPELALHHRVEQAVSRSLSEGVPTLGDIAAHLGMSARTLQRRLADDGGYRFTQLIERARRRLAEQLLRDTQYSLTEVAFLTGFSEQSAFHRAFRRWQGQTPRDFRLGARD